MHLKPKKSLGQNFLVDKNIQRKLIAAYKLKSNEQILEIGAGYGNLTKLAAGNAAFIYALEIDRGLCKILKEDTKGYTNIRVINQDILKFNFRRNFKQLKNRLKVIGNIPYYITTPIIEHLFRYPDKIENIFITVQKEFAKRIIACPGSKNYGSFSCFVQYHSIPKVLFSIKKNCFLPRPEVDSCLLQLDIRGAKAVEVKDERRLFRIIRSAFNQRRKTLRNSLDGIIPPGKIVLFFKEYGISPNIRPEGLTLQSFANLANL
ncbi:MAG: 16S rRNA (adenine(1518)-N(6)/adenine(1519)-N(6))-dimethyltransferase RsmA [Candidatus Omnitrophota bacterium]